LSLILEQSKILPSFSQDGGNAHLFIRVESYKIKEGFTQIKSFLNDGRKPRDSLEEERILRFDGVSVLSRDIDF
jgi:hypothetical protein